MRRVIMLPIAVCKSKIISSVNDNAATIITAETGSGKSTQVCQYLYEAGYDVIVTQPRRIAAVTLANRVSEEVDSLYLVGYHTGREKDFTADTEILFCTDGLQLVKELTDYDYTNLFNKSSKKSKHVLVIDEVHEWNLNIEVLIAWVKKKLRAGWDTKIVIMSATLNHEDLSNYMYDAPVLEIPGAVYSVTTLERSSYEFISSITEFNELGKNVLVFVPGKKEMEDTIGKLEGANATILPLHGELSIAEQKLCFQESDKPKIIVSTNVAQTSITIPDIDVVVDSGTERRVEVIDGVQGLYLKDISKADCMQRRGRAGRTKSGIYVLCGTPMQYRADYAVPEIQRLILDQMVLRLINIGIDATELEFFHQPNIESIIAAKKTLTTMKAIHDGSITSLGKKILEIPISVKYARMIIEADKFGVVDDVVTIASILEVGSLLNHKEVQYFEFTDEDISDLLAELDVWNKLQGRKVNFKEEGIFSKNFFRIKELREDIMKSIEDRHVVTTGTTGNKRDILSSCLMGMMDNIYHNRCGELRDGVSDRGFQPDNKSCVSQFGTQWVIGFPIRIEFADRWGNKQHLDILKSLSAIEESVVMQLLPEMFQTTISDISYNQYEDCVTGYEALMFGNVLVRSTYKEFHDHPDYESLKADFEEREREQKEYRYSRPSSIYRNEPEKQKIVTIEGFRFEIQYPYSYLTKSNPYISVSIEDMMNINNTTSVKLEDGSQLEFYYRGQKSTNIQMMKKNYAIMSSKVQWNSFVKKIPTIKTKKCKLVIDDFLDRVGTFELTNIFGEVTYAYVCLESTDGKIGLSVKKDEKEANDLTTESLKFLVDLKILDKYPNKCFEFKINGKSVLTDKGNKVKIKFTEFVNDCKSELTKENLFEYLDMIDEYYNEVIVELNK